MCATTPSTTAPSQLWARRGTRPRLGFKPDQAAVGGGDADRAAAVVGVRDREHPARHRRRRAAAGAARRARRVPRVAGDPVAAVLRDRDHAELGRVGAPAQHEPGAHERVDDQLALLADAVGGAARAVGHRPARHRREILDRQRHAQERRLRSSPAASRRSASAAAARASSSLRQMTAFSCGSRSSTAARHASSSSDRGELARGAARRPAPAPRRSTEIRATTMRADPTTAALPARPRLSLRAAELHDRDRQHHQPEHGDHRRPRRGRARASPTT